MEELKDENFDLKLRLYRNEEQLRQFKGTQLETLLDKVIGPVDAPPSSLPPPRMECCRPRMTPSRPKWRV